MAQTKPELAVVPPTEPPTPGPTETANAATSKKPRRISRAALKDRARRTRHLISIGEVVADYGLDKHAGEILMGMMELLADQAKDRAFVADCEKRGRAELARREDLKQTEIVEVTFPDGVMISFEEGNALRKLGLVRNRYRAVWEGSVHRKTVDAVVKDLGGQIKKL